MKKWTKIQSVSFLDRTFSDTNERIIPTRNGTPLGVAPKGMHYTGLLRDYDQLTIVDLRPKHISFNLTESDRLATKDGVKIDGTIEITAKVKEDNALLMRLVSNEDEEEMALHSHIKKSVRTIISSIDWTDLTIFSSEQHDNFNSLILDYIKETNVCFTIVEIIDINFSPVDREFADLIEKRRKEKEQEKLQVEKIKASQERLKLEFEREQARLSEERKKEKEQQEHQLELEKEKHNANMIKQKEEHEAELAKKKAEKDLENQIFEERVKLIKENPLALAVLDPQTYKELELAKLKLQLEAESSKNKLLEQFALKGMDNKLARTQGQIEVMQALASERLGIDGKLLLTNDDGGEAKRLQEENDKLKEQLKDNSSNTNLTGNTETGSDVKNNE